MSITHNAAPKNAEIKLHIEYTCPVCETHSKIQLDEKDSYFQTDRHDQSSISWDWKCDVCDSNMYYEKHLF